MIKKNYPGAWYTDALPDGTQAVTFLNRVETHDRVFSFEVGNGPLYVCVTNVNGFQFAGQAHGSNGTWHMSNNQVKLDPRIAHGNFGCIFDLSGELKFIEPSPGATSQGFRYIASNGRAVLGDETLFSNGVSSFTDLDGLLVGQGHERGGVVVWDGEKVRELHPGACYAVRAHRDGNDIAVSFYEVAPDGLEAFVYRGSLEEFLSLPIQGHVDPIEPVKPVPQEPPVPDPTQIAPQAPNVIEVIKNTAAESTLDRVTDVVRGAFTDEVVARLGYFPWGRKDRDRFPETANNSDDALTYRRQDGLFEIYDILAGGTGEPQFDYKGAFKDGENGFFREVPRKAPSVPKEPPVVVPPAPTIPPDYEALKSAVRALDGQIGAVATIVQGLAAELARLAGEVAKERSYEATCGSSWRHTHQITVKEVK